MSCQLSFRLTMESISEGLHIWDPSVSKGANVSSPITKLAQVATSCPSSLLSTEPACKTWLEEAERLDGQRARETLCWEAASWAKTCKRKLPKRAKTCPMPKSAESEVRGELEVLVSSLGLTNHTTHFTTLQADQGRRRSSKIKTTHHTSPHTLLNHTSPHLTTCTFKPHLTTNTFQSTHTF